MIGPMDPLEVLGLGRRATRPEIDDAHRRLRRQIDPSRGGSADLAAIVDAAHRALRNESRVPIAPTIDPFQLFDVPRTATVDQVKVAYRRLAARVHPDRGGTDELFRIVDAAYEAILHPYADLRRRSTWMPREPWPRPRPERAYQPPPPDSRFHAPGWRDWATVAAAASLLAIGFALGALMVVSMTRAPFERKFLLFFLTVGWVIAMATNGRSVTRGLVRALVRARATYARHRGADPEVFLAARCLDSPVNREREDRLYDAYVGWCRGQSSAPMSRWVFIEKLRTLGLLHVQSSTLEHGLFVGIRLRPEEAA